MYALDFEYDGQHLSDFGFIICDFEFKNGFNIAGAGSDITFNKIPRYRGRHYSLTGTQYDECIQTTFGICKNPDLFDDLVVTNDEYRDILRWLNRNEYLKFQVIYEDNYESDPCFYDASFNVKKVTVGDVLYGLELTVDTNKPFGYGVEQVYKMASAVPGTQYRIEDVSDEIGYTYPSVIIKCKEAGNFKMCNDLTGSEMMVYNCTEGETIIIDCLNQIITSSIASHDICNDFNYDFFKLGNTSNTRFNYVTVSIKCDVEIKYIPIVKVTI